MIGLSFSLLHMHTHFYILFMMCNSSNQMIKFRQLEEKLEMGFICYDLYVYGFLCNQKFLCVVKLLINCVKQMQYPKVVVDNFCLSVNNESDGPSGVLCLANHLFMSS